MLHTGESCTRRRTENDESPVLGAFADLSDGLEPSTPAYHGTSQATGGSPWQRIWLVLAVYGLRRFAAACRRLRPRGSIKAPCFKRSAGGVHTPSAHRLT